MFPIDKRSLFPTDERGVSALEFALIAPIMVTILMGMMEFGLILYSYNSAESAARDITRKLATNRLTPGEAQASAQQEMPSWVSNRITVAVSQTAAGDPTNNQFTVDLSFPASAGTPTSFLSWAYRNLTLHSKVIMQQEFGS